MENENISEELEKKIESELKPYAEKTKDSGLDLKALKKLFVKLFEEGSYAKPLKKMGGMENEQARESALELLITLKVSPIVDNPNDTYYIKVLCKQIYEQADFKTDKEGNLVRKNGKAQFIGSHRKFDSWSVDPEGNILKMTGKGKVIDVLDEVIEEGGCYEVSTPQWSEDDHWYIGLYFDEERGSTIKELEDNSMFDDIRPKESMENNFRNVNIPSIDYPEGDMDWVSESEIREVIVIDGMLQFVQENEFENGNTYYGRIGANHLSPEQLIDKNTTKSISASFPGPDIMDIPTGSKAVFICSTGVNQYESKKTGEVVSEPQAWVKGWYVYFEPEVEEDTQEEVSEDETKAFIEKKKQEMKDGEGVDEAEEDLLKDFEECEMFGQMLLDDEGCAQCYKDNPEYWGKCAKKTGITQLESAQKRMENLLDGE